MKKSFLLSLSVALFVITSCSLEKRRYSGGYHLEWNKRPVNTATIKRQNQEATAADINVGIKEQEKKSDLPVSASTTIDIQTTVPEKENIIPSTTGEPRVEERSNPISARNEQKKSEVSTAGPAPAPVDERKTHGLAIAAMVLGILSLISFYGSFVFGLLGIIFGGSAIKRIRQNPEKYKGLGMARAGLICGIIGVALIILLIAVLV